jgi:hypothetical protein
VRVAWLVVLGACGRVGFGTIGDGARSGDGTADVLADTSADGSGVTNCVGTLLCDTFDGPSLGTEWILDNLAGTTTLDTSRAYRGTSSLHLHIDQITTSTSNPRACLLTNQGLPITGMLYTRAWMYFSSPMPTTPFAQMLNFANSAGQGVSMGASHGAVTSNDYATGGYMESPTVALPLGRWTCVQLEVPTGTIATVRVRIDGAEVTDIALPQTMAQPAPNQAIMGIAWIGTLTSQPAFDAWMDELIISASPTTCAQ